jgi:hypothetical protein
MSKVFSLEAVFAKKGDALILHYGSWENPRWILIDGGPGGVYNDYLRPRLEQIREDFEIDANKAIPFEMVMVSHIDDDHINGILQLFDDQEDAVDRRKRRPYRIGTLWHNSFDDILGNEEDEIVSRLAAVAAGEEAGGLELPAGMSPEARAVVASTRQGRNLRRQARKLQLDINAPFEGLVMAPAERKLPLKEGLDLTVLGPLLKNVEDFRKRWDKDLKKILEKESASTRAASFSDGSPFNLASISVLAELDGKTMLLTGDARGDFLLEGLEELGLLRQDRPMKVDLLKVPHHGSDRNVTVDFFRRIPARHYVISGDGEHGNPERATLDMIETARADDDYTIHFTFTETAHETEEDEERRHALERVAAWVQQRPRNCTVVFREDLEEVYSVIVDLLDPLYDD